MACCYEEPELKFQEQMSTNENVASKMGAGGRLPMRGGSNACAQKRAWHNAS